MPDYKGDDLNADLDAVWETAARNFPAMAQAPGQIILVWPSLKTNSHYNQTTA